MTNVEVPEQSNGPLANYLRVHRRNASLTQHELGMILGYTNCVPISRHERFETIPPFLMALGYQVVFRIEASEMFPGLTETVELNVEAKLAEFEVYLKRQNICSPRGRAIARKLEWLEERKLAR